MTEDVFRIVVSGAVASAALAFVIQAGVVILFYRASKKTQHVLTKFMGDVKPVLVKTGTMLTAANQIMDDARPQIKEFTADTVVLAKSGREQVQRLGNLLHDASERARTRLEQIDHTVESTVEQVEHVGDTVKRAVIKPVKEVNGLAAGISATVATLVHGSRKSGTS
jgi:uncharacterized protein YoxC